MIIKIKLFLLFFIFLSVCYFCTFLFGVPNVIFDYNLFKSRKLTVFVDLLKKCKLNINKCIFL